MTLKIMKMVFCVSLRVRLIIKVRVLSFYSTVFFKNLFKITKETCTTGFYNSQNIKTYGMTNANFKEQSLWGHSNNT